LFRSRMRYRNTLSKCCSLRAKPGLCLMSNTSPKFIDPACSGSQTHPCSHRAVAICARVLGSAPNLCRSRPPERTPPCAIRARRGFFWVGWISRSSGCAYSRDHLPINCIRLGKSSTHGEGSSWGALVAGAVRLRRRSVVHHGADRKDPPPRRLQRSRPPV
jgi:hypothetical protein